MYRHPSIRPGQRCRVPHSGVAVGAAKVVLGRQCFGRVLRVGPVITVVRVMDWRRGRFVAVELPTATVETRPEIFPEGRISI